MPLLLLPLSVWIAAMVLLALALTVNSWGNAISRMIAAPRGGGILSYINLTFRVVLGIVQPGVNYLAHVVTKAASHYMQPLAHWFHGLTDYTLANAVAFGLFAERTAIGFERLTTVVLPREIGKAVKPANRKAVAALGLAGLTAAALKRFAHGIDRLLHEQVIPGLRHAEHAVTVTLPRDIARVRSRVGALERDLANPSKAWLRRIAAAMWGAALLGLLVKWLARRFPWLFCRKVKTVGNRLCGLDGDLLNSLIADTLIIGGALSVATFARELQAIEDEAVGLMRRFIVEL